MQPTAVRIYFGILLHTCFYKTRRSNWRSIGANLQEKKIPPQTKTSCVFQVKEKFDHCVFGQVNLLCSFQPLSVVFFFFFGEIQK